MELQLCSEASMRKVGRSAMKLAAGAFGKPVFCRVGFPLLLEVESSTSLQRLWTSTCVTLEAIVALQHHVL